MSTTLEPQAQPLKLGIWYSKLTGNPVELTRVNGSVCWYSIPEFQSEQVIAASRWLESMRPA